MAGTLESVRDCAQSHPISVAAGLIIALPGTYFLMTGMSITCAMGRTCTHRTLPSSSPLARITKGLSVYEIHNPLDIRLNFPNTKWTDGSGSTFLLQIFNDAFQNLVLLVTTTGNCLGIYVRRLLEVLENRWTPQFSYLRLFSVAISTALPGAFLVFIRDHPESWAARHQTKIANALHVFALVSVANQRLCVQDLLVAGFVLVSFEALQLGMVRGGHKAKSAPAAFETLLSRTHGIVAKSDFGGSPMPRKRQLKDAATDVDSSVMMAASKDEEVVAEPDCEVLMAMSGGDSEDSRIHDDLLRMQQGLIAAKTSEKAKELELKRVQKELQHARNTLNENFVEYSNLRDEMKTMKQTLGSEHQAVVYRKDIELFALRKSNEQKETYIKERETKLEDIYRQQKTSLELKDAQIRNLKDRIAFLERQQSPRLNGEFKVDSAVENETQDAVQVRLLRVKGRNSSEIESALEEKETEIATLKIDLAKAMSACDALGRTQGELRRAWDSIFEVQKMLNDERQRHIQTHSKLQEAANHLEDELKRRGVKNPATALPTIEEQDKNELEAMFNAAQEDNLRLYTTVEALEKRVREANSRLFTSEQEAEALTEQLRLEKAINEDMKTARPSLVHRVHFQRMEGQVKEIRDELALKEDEIDDLKRTVDNKDGKFAQLEKDRESAAANQAKLQEENARLRNDVKDLEATKERLILDHERLAQHRSRHRNSSAEHTSARSSATLFTDAPNQPVAITSDEPLPARPVPMAQTPTRSSPNSIQNTPEMQLNDNPQGRNIISNNAPPPELRGSRRRSLTLKGLMKKFVRKDEIEEQAGAEEDTKTKKDGEQQRPKTALVPKDSNKLIRPKTATAAPTSKTTDFAVPALPKAEKDIKSDGPVKQSQDRQDTDLTKVVTPSSKPKLVRSPTPRFYAAHPDGRPMTAAPTTGTNKHIEEQTSAESKAEAMRPTTAVSPASAAKPVPVVAKAKEEADVGKAKTKKSWAASRRLVRRSIA